MNKPTTILAAAAVLASVLLPTAARADSDLLPPAPVVTSGEYKRVHIGDCKSRVHHIFRDDGSIAFQGAIYLNRYYLTTDLLRVEVVYAKSYGCWRVTEKRWDA